NIYLLNNFNKKLLNKIPEVGDAFTNKGLGTNKKAIPFNKQDYQTLKQECLAKKTLFCDPTFPAESASLGYNELGPQSSQTRGVQWKRPKELCSNPQFIVDGATRTDICQGALGDCWLLAAIASLTLEKEFLERVVPHGQSFKENYAGIFHFQLWQCGEWVDVVIDDRLPTRNGRLLFVQSAEGSEFWSALLEKAYAKVNGSYEALTGGLANEGFEDFTGGIAESYNLSKDSSHLFKLMQKALTLRSLMACFISTSSQEIEAKTSLKLVKGHAYSVTGAKEVHSYGRLVQLVRLRNPWGQVEWTGPWSDNSKEWNSVQPEEKAKLVHSAEDGEFWMAYSDFIQNFSWLEICNQTPDALSSDTVSRWKFSQFEGDWRVGSTAGGCLNNPVSFCSNPQYVIKLEEEDDDPYDGKDGCTILVGLMQKDFRKVKRFGQNPNAIGFTIYKVTGYIQSVILLVLEITLYTTNNFTTRCKGFTSMREVSERFKLPTGEYVIIPSTFEPNRNGSFVLRVFTEKEAAARFVQSVFSIFQFKKGYNMRLYRKLLKIGILCLQCFVVFHTGTDVKTDGFSMETCRLIITMLNTECVFSVIPLQEAFKKHDTDNSGTMSSYEMRDAMKEAGFQLNNEVLQVIISRYANQQCTVDFDSFVGCLIHLEMLFQMFKRFDKKDTGKIELDILQVTHKCKLVLRFLYLLNVAFSLTDVLFWVLQWLCLALS
uniref:Calpain 8 n=1 Tax=Cyprinus carpio TaxID=7962 RepID=A0A8C2IKI5_CYPCA